MMSSGTALTIDVSQAIMSSTNPIFLPHFPSFCESKIDSQEIKYQIGDLSLCIAREDGVDSFLVIFTLVNQKLIFDRNSCVSLCTALTLSLKSL